MKIKIRRPTWIKRIRPGSVKPEASKPPEDVRPDDGIDPAVKAGMAYLLRKNAELYRRLAE